MADFTHPFALFVRHRGEPKMSCKVFVWEDEWIASHKERTPTQDMEKRSAPGGVDLEALRFLIPRGIERWVHTTYEGKAWTVPLMTLLMKGDHETWGGRNRSYLPLPFWTPCAAPPDRQHFLEEYIIDASDAPPLDCERVTVKRKPPKDPPQQPPLL